MALVIKHTKVSTIPDGSDPSLVLPSDWNADHSLVGVADVSQGGTGVGTLTGIVKGNGTGAFTAATGAEIVAAIGATAVQNATNATNLTGTLAIANGGTGATTATAALNALLPTQTGNSGKVLGTDGTNTSWVTQSAGGGVTKIIAGSNVTIDPPTGLGDVTINAGGAPAAQSSTVTWNYGGTPVNLFEIAIPSWANSAVVNIIGLSNGQANPGNTVCFRVGGSVLTTGYVGGYGTSAADASFTNCLITINTTAAASALTGQHLLDNLGNNQWMTQGQHWRNGDNIYMSQNCSVTTASMPTALVFQAGGTGTFDAGQVIVQFSSANSASVQNIIATTQSSGAFKTTLGYNAGGSGTGAFNTCIGQTAGQSLTTAQGNTLIGSQAGLGITTGNNNTIVGSYQGSAALANTFAAYDGAGNNKLTVSQTNALSIGTSGTGAIGSVLTSQGSGQVTWTYTNVLEYAFYTQSSTIPTTSQDVFFANCSAGSFTLTLPPASGNGGKAFYIKRTDTVVANTLNIASSGGLIEGASSSTQGPGVAVYYISDGTNWWELANG